MTRSSPTLEERIMKALEDFPGGLTTEELETLLQVDKRTLRPKISKMLAQRTKIKKTNEKRSNATGKGRPFTVLQKLTRENQWT